MKKFFLMLAAICSLTFGGLMTTGCQYDDTDIWNEIDNVKNELKDLKSQVNQMQVVVNKLSENKGIVSVTDTENGYLLTFTDNSTLLLNHGKDGQNGADGQDGADGSQIGVKEVDGIYYWTVDGELILVNGEKVAVTGKDGADGHSPELSIDAEGFWCVDGERILVEEAPVPAKGDSFFKNVETKDGKVIFTLSDGSQFTIEMNKTARLALQAPEYIMTMSGYDLTYEAEGLSHIDLYNIPEGWSAHLDESQKSIHIEVAENWRIKNGERLVLVGTDENGKAYIASVKLYYSGLNKAEFVVYNEGWFGHEGATLNAYFDGIWKLRTYQEANPGKKLGTTGTVAVSKLDHIYAICKDGQQVTELDKFTSKEISVLNLEKGEQAQNIFLWDGLKGYLTTTGGVYELTLTPLKIVKKIYSGNATDVHGVRQNLYFISDKKIYSYNTVEEKTAPVEIGTATTGFANKNNYIWAADGDKLKKINPMDNTVETIKLGCDVNINKWAYTPTCLAKSEVSNSLYFASGNSIKEFNIETGEVSNLWSQPSGREFYGAAIAVQPYYGNIYAISKKAGWGENGKDVNIVVINPQGKEIKTIKYTDVENTYWFPSQILFINY